MLDDELVLWYYQKYNTELLEYLQTRLYVL